MVIIGATVQTLRYEEFEWKGYFSMSNLILKFNCRILCTRSSEHKSKQQIMKVKKTQSFHFKKLDKAFVRINGVSRISLYENTF